MSTPLPPDCYFVPVDVSRFRPTIHTQGAWAENQQHMAPIAGLLVDALESCSPRADMTISRVAFDILGVIAAEEMILSSRVIRPGRTVELLEAELSMASAPQRVVVRATAWRLERSDTSSIAGNDFVPLPPPEEGIAITDAAGWPGGFIRSLDIRACGERSPGRSQVWLRSDVPLIAGRTASDLAGLFALMDTANGVAARVRPDEVLFPNVDLTVHLFRQPRGQWLGLNTSVSFGSDGTGLTAAELHDVDGPIGRAAQTLTVRILPS